MAIAKRVIAANVLPVNLKDVFARRGAEMAVHQRQSRPPSLQQAQARHCVETAASQQCINIARGVLMLYANETTKNHFNGVHCAFTLYGINREEKK
jgi:hypothetical protein